MTKPIYNSYISECKQPFGAVATGEAVKFTVHLPKTMQAETVWLRVFLIDHWNTPTDIKMHFLSTDSTSNSYTCTYMATQAALYVYHFETRSINSTITIKKQGDNCAGIGDGELWQLTVYDANMKTPAALGDGVIYQIFPDRFNNSSLAKANIPTGRTIHSKWGDLPIWWPDSNGEITNSDYFGGDLQGITQKLDYLVELGVTSIYLNPIFEAHSNHRYNTADYNNIDPLLGTTEDFENLCSQAKERGISIILDGVFSHTGSDSVYFNKEGRYGKGGAYNDQNSPYSPWFRFWDFPHSYESWWGFTTLPNIEETQPSYLEFICGENGVLRKWMRLGAAGYRLDVADELPDAFLDCLYACVKEENPEAIVLGEVWEDASNKVSYGVRRRYLLGKQLDSVMNYPFKDALLDYVRHGGGSSLYSKIMLILENYPKPVIPALMNSLSTHDTPRAITVLVGDYLNDNNREWQATHHGLTSEQYQLGARMFILTTILQYGLPGLPCLYYGDEAGICGYRDPFNRTCYPWGSEDKSILSATKILGAIRKNYPIFSSADFLPITFDDNICSFVRKKDNTRILFAVNRSSQARPILLPYRESFEVEFASGNFADGVLGAHSGIVLVWM